MRGLIARHLAPVALVAVGAAAGIVLDAPAWGLIVGSLLATSVAVALAVNERRRLRAIGDAFDHLRRGEPLGQIPYAVHDEIDQAAYDGRRLAIELSTRITSANERATQQGLLIDRMHDGLMWVGADGTVMLANVTAGAMFGGRNPTGRSFIRVTRDHELNDALFQCLEGGDDRHVTLELPADQRLVSAHISRLPTPGPEALIVFRDITEVSRLQNLRRDFVANVSHELRTPLSTIKILTETLIDLREDDHEAIPFLEKIDAEVDAMTSLVRDLLDLARLENQGARLTLRPIDLGRLIEDVCERSALLAERHQVELRAESGDRRLVLLGDERRFHQAMLNLVTNAIDHSPRRSVVTISARSDGDDLLLTVKDAGEGIGADDLPRIWERFYKTDRSRSGSGTGLGLAIVKHITQAHGGTAEVSSVVGAGSEFTLRFPRHYSQAGSVPVVSRTVDPSNLD